MAAVSVSEIVLNIAQGRWRHRLLQAQAATFAERRVVADCVGSLAHTLLGEEVDVFAVWMGASEIRGGKPTTRYLIPFFRSFFSDFERW